MPNGRRRQSNTAHANRQRNLQRAIEVQATQVHVAPVVVEALEMADVRSGEVKKLKGQIVGLKNKINNIEKQLKNNDQKIKEAKDHAKEWEDKFFIVTRGYVKKEQEYVKTQKESDELIQSMKSDLKEGVEYLVKQRTQIRELNEIKDGYKILAERTEDQVNSWFKSAEEKGSHSITHLLSCGREVKFKLVLVQEEKPKDLSKWVVAGGHYGDY
jgi:chromosome segregation ATPase